MIGETVKWYKMRLTKAEALQGKSERLIGELRDLLRSIGPDPAIAVYSSQVKDQVVDIYFSPAAVTAAMGIIHRYWGSPSEPPPPTATLILGSSAVQAK